MVRASKTPRAILRRKQDKLNWSLFNFFENLLVFCATPSRSVPPESGVEFHISSKVKDEGVCVLFKIDRRRDPLIRGRAIKPDYMAFYASRNGCICTIIEMKGRERKNLEHGIEQIKELRDRLRTEISEHLPGACKGRIKFQGILLMPFNADVPRIKIQNEAQAGFHILPLQYDHKAELYRYVRTEVHPSHRYVHAKLPHEPDEFNAIERLLVQAALPARMKDALSERRAATGIHLHYVHLGGPDEDYAALIADKSGAQIATLDRSAPFRTKIEAELTRLGLRYKSLRFTSIPTTEA
jgi:hypothetical protein